MEKEIFYKKLDGDYKEVKLGYSINPETEECSLEEVLAPSTFRPNEDELKNYVADITGVDNDSITVSYHVKPKQSIWSKIKSAVSSAVKTYAAPVAISLGLGIAAGAGAYAATGGKLKNIIHSEKTITEDGTITWDAYLNASHSNNAYIEMTLDAENNTYTLVGIDGKLKTQPHNISAKDLSVTGGLNGFNLSFMKPAGTANNSYTMSLESYLKLNDFALNLTNNQHAYINGKDIALQGSGQLNGWFKDNATIAGSQPATITIDSGSISGYGNLQNSTIYGGSGLITFDGTKINGKMTLNGTELHKLINIWTNNTNMSQTGSGYVQIGNAMCPVTNLTWDWVLKQLNATQNATLANQSITMNFEDAYVYGTANITNIQARMSGIVDMHLAVDRMNGSMSNFRADVRGGVAVDASNLRLNSNNAQIWVNGTWKSTAELNNTHANNITGYVSMDLEKILQMTQYGTGANGVEFRNVYLRGENTTIDSYNLTIDPDNPMVMKLAKNSTVKYRGNMMDLYMHGEGKTTSTWKFNYENPHMLLIPMGIGFGLLGGLDRGHRKATKKQVKTSDIKRAYESGIDNGIQRVYQDKNASALAEFIGQKDVELNEKIDTNDMDLNEKINDNHAYVKSIFNHPKTGVKKKLKIIRNKLGSLETKIDKTYGTPDEIAKMNQDVDKKQAEA